MYIFFKNSNFNNNKKKIKQKPLEKNYKKYLWNTLAEDTHNKNIEGQC